MPSPADAERIARRYPRQRTSPAALIAVGAVIVALVAWVVWVAINKASPSVTGRVDSFAVVSDTETRARITIDRPDPSVPARCLLFVQAVTYERVGEKYVDVPAGSHRLTALDVSVRTFKRGTSITVEACGPVG